MMDVQKPTINAEIVQQTTPEVALDTPELIIDIQARTAIAVTMNDQTPVEAGRPEIVITRSGAGAVDSVNGMTGDVVLGYANLATKPFNDIDNHTLVVSNGSLKVNTTDNAEEDNTRPITSSGVHAIVGNIESILSQI